VLPMLLRAWQEFHLNGCAKAITFQQPKASYLRFFDVRFVRALPQLLYDRVEFLDPQIFEADTWRPNVDDLSRAAVMRALGL
jgi:hypothetical protein